MSRQSSPEEFCDQVRGYITYFFGSRMPAEILVDLANRLTNTPQEVIEQAESVIEDYRAILTQGSAPRRMHPVGRIDEYIELLATRVARIIQTVATGMVEGYTDKITSLPSIRNMNYLGLPEQLVVLDNWIILHNQKIIKNRHNKI